jgi:hypothetical protein
MPTSALTFELLNSLFELLQAVSVVMQRPRDVNVDRMPALFARALAEQNIARSGHRRLALARVTVAHEAPSIMLPPLCPIFRGEARRSS